MGWRTSQESLCSNNHGFHYVLQFLHSWSPLKNRLLIRPRRVGSVRPDQAQRFRAMLAHYLSGFHQLLLLQWTRGLLRWASPRQLSYGSWASQYLRTLSASHRFRNKFGVFHLHPDNGATTLCISCGGDWNWCVRDNQQWSWLPLLLPFVPDLKRLWFHHASRKE